MLGSHELPKSASGAATGGRAAILALVLAAAGLFTVIGTAQAQDCEGGYRMLKSEIPVACDGGVTQSATGATAPVLSEPLHTGSINRLGVGGGNADELPAPATSSNGMKCVGGFAYRPTAENSYVTMPMPCN